MSELFWIILVICISVFLIVFTIVFFSKFSIEWVKYRSLSYRMEHLEMKIECLYKFLANADVHVVKFGNDAEEKNLIDN